MTAREERCQEGRGDSGKGRKRCRCAPLAEGRGRAGLWQHKSKEGERGTAERMDGGVFILTVFLKPVLHVLDNKKNYWGEKVYVVL